MDHVSHQLMLGIYQWNFGTAFHSDVPTEEEMDWLSTKYPDTFDKYYRPRWNYMKEQVEKGKPFKNMGLGKLCQVCQSPCLYTEPDDPTMLCHRETVFENEKYQFCSDHCMDIFNYEPEKYVQAYLPMNQIFQAPFFGDLDAWMDWVDLKDGVDNGDYQFSEDKKNFDKWRNEATSNSVD